MEIDWKRVEAKLHKREDVLNDPEIAGKSEAEKEAYWQREINRYEISRIHLIEHPRFRATEDEIDLRLMAIVDLKGWSVWHWRVQFSIQHSQLLNANGAMAGNEDSEALAKAAAEKAYLRLKEVKTAVEALRRGFWAKWGGPEK